MKKRFHYPALQCLLWGIYGVAQTYLNRYLLEEGLTNTQIGVMLGVSTGAAFLLQPAFGALTDSRRLTVRRVLLICSAVLFLGMAVLLLPVGVGAIVLFYALGYTMVNVMPSFANALGVQGIKAGMPIDIGRARGMGSVAFSITSQVGSWLIAAYGLKTVPLFTLLLAGCLIAVVARFPQVNAETEKKDRGSDGAVAFFRRNPSIALFLLAAILLNISHSAIRNSMYQIAVWKGNVNAHGTAMSMGAFLELPVMFAFTFLLTKKRCAFWLRFCATFFCVRSLLMLVLPGVAGLYAAQTMQALGSAMYIVASVYYLAEVLHGTDAVRAQWYAGTTGTFASLVAYVASGSLLDRVSIPALLTITTLLAFAGMLMMYFAVYQVEKSRKTAAS